MILPIVVSAIIAGFSGFDASTSRRIVAATFGFYSLNTFLAAIETVVAVMAVKKVLGGGNGGDEDGGNCSKTTAEVRVQVTHTQSILNARFYIFYLERDGPTNHMGELSMIQNKQIKNMYENLCMESIRFFFSLIQRI